ncbi:hypothetical protein IVB03_14130 [Bradyrhizobium sp. 168]|uniref:hypothetical protein n=1 Tax=Bradyrhizobium sp. 168 TaxID=2782639 RepID=UPI001FFA6196|nr:hypothetical protein [Bradyrhizobium sp. 168]MCK1580690.1 hypothetical protein [Bradyrhizobium sp. 168]
MKERKSVEPSKEQESKSHDRSLPELLLSAIENVRGSVNQTKRAVATGADWASARSAWKVTQEHLEVIASLSHRIAEFDRELQERAEQEFFELERGLRDALGGLGFRIDGTWPKLFVERAVALEFMESNHSAILGGVRIADASVSKIVSQIKPIVQELFPKNFSSAAFLAKLKAAYDLAKSTSDQVPIFDVYRSYVILSQKPRFWRDAREKSFTGTSLEQFRAQLSRSLEEVFGGPADGIDIRLLPPLDPKDALFLYLPAEARFGYVGRIHIAAGNSAS